LRNIKIRAESAKSVAEALKDKMVEHVDEENFEDGVKHLVSPRHQSFDKQMNDIIKAKNVSITKHSVHEII